MVSKNEAFRHEQLQKGNCEPASFGPKRKRQEAGVLKGKTVRVRDRRVPEDGIGWVAKVTLRPAVSCKKHVLG